MKMPHSKEEFFYWSYFACLASILLKFWLSTNVLPDGTGFMKLLIGTLVPASLVFAYWLFIRWVAITAEQAGRSFVAFMIFAIIAPVLAWIVVIMFKKPQTT